MKLKVMERFAVKRSLNEFKQGKFEDLIVKEDIDKKISFLQEELDTLEIKTLENGNIQWNNEKDEGLEIDFTDREKELIKQGFEKINEKEEATPDLLSAYKLFNA